MPRSFAITTSGMPEGSYSFRLIVVSVENPDEEFAIGPAVGLELRRPVAPPRKKPPLWIALLAAGVLLITAGAITAGILLGRDDSGVGGSGSAPTVSLGFDSRSAYVDLGQPPALDFTGNLTIEAWIRPRTTGGFHNILAAWNPR